MSFLQKVQLSRSLSLDESENRMWDLIIALNQLRNKLAHTLDHSVRESKLIAIKNLYFEICSDLNGIDKHRNQEDKIIVAYAIGECLGFLSSFEKEIERFKDFVGMLDKAVNPHRNN